MIYQPRRRGLVRLRLAIAVTPRTFAAMRRDSTRFAIHGERISYSYIGSTAINEFYRMQEPDYRVEKSQRKRSKSKP